MKMGRAKLAREGRRIRDQTLALLRLPTDAYAQYRHDRDFATLLHRTDGQRGLRDRIAIFLLYQPKGLRESTLLTCDHLAAEGYAVLAISNAPLSPADLARLAPRTWRILERPNFGYDFGGYRDGLRVLREEGIAPKVLVILNDSIWWPVMPDDRTLERMEATGADIVGMIHHRPRKRRDGRERRYLHSYFYRFGARALASPAFQAFWANYRLSSLKHNAIRRGELSLTQALVDAGLSAGALFSREDLMSALETEDDDYLAATLRFATFKTPDLKSRADALVDTAPHDGWRGAVLTLLRDMFAESEFQIAAALPAFDLLGLNYLKKSPSEPATSQYFRMRDAFLGAVDQGLLPSPIPAVLLEIGERQAIGAAAVGR